ncbi:DUF4214 domain-containing protein [Sinorhizobium fredii]|uniref:DUF4214 domain-containing protein n=1 Tax=Rhizobium fredii TaxID=380 RepID=UPI001295ADEA|nr:DUF4214 domain-containing protein [Sinorhizobium fredii]MQW96233.1 DUF4214 domain-containing protein [Sinorhizobium fredii]UTY46263.1 DUF4214 domain-containing protein [Sinorhizobium fredii]
MSIRLAFASACLLATTATASADTIWGVNGHPLVSYPGVTIEQQLDYIKDLGMKSYRVDVHNADAGTTELLAALVREGKERGIDILPVIAGEFELEKDSADDLYRKARDLAVALGSRFKDDIRVWELGNEMENYAIIKPCEKRDDGTQYPCEWGAAGGTSPLDYYRPRWAKVSAVLKGLSEGMTEVDPAIRKAMGTAGWGHTGAFERMRQDGIQWDISVWHMYGEDPEWAFEKLARYGKPIWVTEFNNPYGSQRGDMQQAEGLRQAMARLRDLQGKYKVEAAHVYELLDEKYWAPDFEAFMGLVRLYGREGLWRVGEPKPAYLAVRQFIRGPRPAVRPRRDCDLADVHAADDLPVRKAKFVYCLILGRDGDGAEGEKWATSMQNGEATYTNMVHSLMRSDEFEAKYATFSLTERSYVTLLYRLLVGREPDEYGLASYVKQIRAGTMDRWAVVEGLITSSEFYAHHKAHLEELPDNPG